MIVTGGTLRGRRIASPSGGTVRPTPARVKEALFSIFAERIPDARVLDCFAGTGALGIEALSRGAAFVTFIEAHAATARAIKATLAAFAVDASRYVVLPRKVEQATAHLRGPFDIILADPPYAQPPPLPFFSQLLAAGLLSETALIMYEHIADAPPFDTAPFTLTRREKWGEVGATFLRHDPGGHSASGPERA